MLGSVELEDYMIQNPARVYKDDNVFTAIKIILELKISGVCVVDGDNNLIGVLSEIDCLQAILSATYNEGSVGTVAEFMTGMDTLVTAGIHDDIVDVATDMLKKKHRRRPVVSEGKLVGQITCRRLLMAVKKFSDG